LRAAESVEPAAKIGGRQLVDAARAELGHEPHVEVALVEVYARLRAVAALVGVTDQRAEMFEELVAEFGQRRRGGTDTEVAAIVVGRDAARLKASIFVDELSGTVSAADVVRLAQNQQMRIAAALR